MIEIGKWNTLKITRKKDFGVYLADEEDETKDVLLPSRQVPKDAKIGDMLKVFIYKDSMDRLISTMKTPYITIDELAVLRCVSTSSIGAFMDWGLEKDLLMPFKQQTGKVVEGKDYLVRMYLDKTERLCVSMKLYNYLSTDSPYSAGDIVTCIVYESNPELGAFVAVDAKYNGLIPRREIHTKIMAGDILSGRVTKVRDDGKLYITTLKPIDEQMKEDCGIILNIIKSYDGILPFDDKTDKEVIERECGLSKNAFKRAVGRLLKSGAIIKKENKIFLNEEGD